MNPQPLPQLPATGLHILPPWLPLVFLLALLLAAFVWLLRWWLKRQGRTVIPPIPKTGPADAPSVGFNFIVNRIENTFGKTHDYRAGLHALAAAVRTPSGAPPVPMTACTPVPDTAAEMPAERSPSPMSRIRASAPSRTRIGV